MNTQRWIIVAAATVFALWVAFVLEPAAHADEASFVNGVYDHSVPITPYTLTLGHQICADVSANGVAGLETESNYAAIAGVSAHDAAVLIVLAVDELCPSNEPALNAWLYPATVA